MNERIYYSQQTKQQAKRETLVLVIMVAGLSISIGAMISLLFAPRPGKSTREQLNDQMQASINKGQKIAKSTGKQLRDTTEQTLNNLNDRVQPINN